MLRDRFSLFWTWWIGELKALFIRKSIAKAPGYASYCELYLDGGHLEVTDVSRGKDDEERNPVADLEPEDGDQLASLLMRRNRPVILAVAQEKCFLHTIEVPRAALSRIDQLLTLELARVTPFTATEVLSGWYETGDTASATHTTVAQIVAKRSMVAPLLQNLARLNVPVAGIFARAATGDYLPAGLKNPEIAVGDRGIERWRKLAVESCAFACLGAAIAGWTLFSRQAGELEDLSQRIEIAQKKALAVRKRLDQMEASSQRIVDLKRAKLDGPSPLAIWEELTRLMPDTAWVSALAIEKTQVTIEGNARFPEELIPLLDGSPLFEAVSFTAPVTKLPGNDLTRFVIRLSLSRDLKVSSAAP
jgi:general secretion pathway protein L